MFYNINQCLNIKISHFIENNLFYVLLDGLPIRNTLSKGHFVGIFQFSTKGDASCNGGDTTSTVC